MRRLLWIASFSKRRYLGVGYALILLAMVFGLSDIWTLGQEGPKPAPIFRGNPNAPKIAFGCNVFWGEEFLPGMLDTLDRENVKITFFIGGSWAKRYPDVLKDIAGRGHELANHTYSHPHPNRLNKEQNQKQITDAEVLIEELTGTKTRLYSPPYGEYNDTVLRAAQELGYTTIMWTADTVDWKRPSPEVIKQRVLKKACNGAIILIHPTEPTMKALPDLIRQLKEAGYQVTTVADILQ